MPLNASKFEAALWPKFHTACARLLNARLNAESPQQRPQPVIPPSLPPPVGAAEAFRFSLTYALRNGPKTKWYYERGQWHKLTHFMASLKKWRDVCSGSEGLSIPYWL